MRRIAALLLIALCLVAADAQARGIAGPGRRGTGIPPQMLWAAAVDVDSYIIYCGTSTGTYNQSDDVGNVLYVKIADTTLSLTPGTDYYCAVRSVADAVESEDSNEVCFHWNGPTRRTTSC